jgi:hypothetical protein
LEITAFYLALAKGLAILYLAFFIPLMVVAEFMRWFNRGHIDDRRGGEALMVAIVLTIFLLVLKIAGDTQEIKNSLSSARYGANTR